MSKLLGTPLLLAGICLLHQSLVSPRKSRLSALWELSQALSFLSRGVSALRTPMPRLLLSRGFGAWGDGFFAAVYEGAFQRNETLGESWRAAAEKLPLFESEQKELAALGGEFSAGAGELGQKLDACAQMLHTQWQNARIEQKEREKTEGPVVLCSALLVIILLI